jgi:4,5-DOPA dioxygenase extradiol
MNAIEDSDFARGWVAVAARLPKPRAIVVVSAHWVSEGVRVTANARPRTIHDFARSFPQALFDVQYPAPGDRDLARDITQRLSAYAAQLDESWGLDHGAWSILVHMYPDADIPVLQVSLDARRNPEQHYEIGRALASLRDDNILVLASGNIVHNLRAFFTNDQSSQAAAQTFETYIDDCVLAHNHAAVVNYKHHPAAREAAPDWDHFTPVIYGLAFHREGEAPELFNRHVSAGISMTSIAYGLPA